MYDVKYVTEPGEAIISLPIGCLEQLLHETLSRIAAQQFLRGVLFATEDPFAAECVCGMDENTFLAEWQHELQVREPVVVRREMVDQDESYTCYMGAQLLAALAQRAPSN